APVSSSPSTCPPASRTRASTLPPACCRPSSTRSAPRTSWARWRSAATPASWRRRRTSRSPPPRSWRRRSPPGSTPTPATSPARPRGPDATQPAILLSSDGQETRGSALAEASMTEPPVPIFPVALPETELPRATIRRVLAPVRAPEHVMVPIEAVVESHAPAPADATLVLAADDDPPREIAATLLPGLTLVALPYRARGRGRHRLAAAVRPPPDAPPPPAP